MSKSTEQMFSTYNRKSRLLSMLSKKIFKILDTLFKGLRKPIAGHLVLPSSFSRKSLKTVFQLDRPVSKCLIDSCKNESNF